MKLLQEPKLSEEIKCSYLENRKMSFDYFFAYDLDEEELDFFLSLGWRKFGVYYFRPNCDDCLQCEPLRVPVDLFIPSKSQRRVIRKADAVKVIFKYLEYRDEIYDIYEEHSVTRFQNKETSKDEFKQSFYVLSCLSMQSEFYIDGKLFAVGFLDISTKGVSSVYFIYKDGYEYLSPGTLGILKEIEFAKKIGKEYYYLGYYIEENKSMNYKNRFLPYEKLNWLSNQWELYKKIK